MAGGAKAEEADHRGAPRALDNAERTYRDALAALRFAQIYWFWLVLELLLRPLLYLNQLLAYGVFAALSPIFPNLAPGAPPSAGFVADVAREPAFAIALFAVWALFAANARLRTHWSVWPVAAAVALYNLSVVSGSLLVPDAEAYDGLRRIEFEGRVIDFAPEVDLATAAIFGIYAAFHIHILYVAFRAQRSIAGLAPSEREAFADIAPNEPTPRGSLRRLLYLPAALKFSRRRAIAGALSLGAGASNLVNYWLALIAAQGMALLPLAFVVLSAMMPPASAAAVCALIVVVVGGAGFALIGLVRAFVRLARRFMRRSLEDMQLVDQRLPILFLRSFLDDQVALPTRDPTWEQWLLDASSRSLNFDLIALEEGSAVGPVVALGDPSDPAPPYGAARGYFDHDDWQAAVARLCDEARAVILVLDETEGVKWEIARLSNAPLLGKTLYMLAPGDVDAPRGRMLMTRALASVGAPAAIAETTGLFAFWIDEDGAVAALTSESRSSYAYMLALRSFLRREAGGASDQPESD